MKPLNKLLSLAVSLLCKMSENMPFQVLSRSVPTPKTLDLFSYWPAASGFC